MLLKADEIRNEYRRLRVKALIGLLRIFGKRRSEIARLKNIDLIIKDNYLEISWTISKKHKRGLHQYIQFVKKQIAKGELPSNYLDIKQYSDLLKEHESWTKTQEGFRIKQDIRVKKVSVENQYAKPIIEYWLHMKANYGKVTYLFPSCVCTFGSIVMINPNNHLSGSQLLRLIKAIDCEAWLHLFRESKGAQIAHKYGNDIIGVAKVRDMLDLEEESTAYRYIRRYAVQTMETTD